ncbi:MAG: mandelate racemase, partial [Verrucomicrobiota bacterium]|nr:mandelate racemase [Verrucomicrobiota bacterium]
MPTIQTISTYDFRRKLKDGAGSDAVHTDPSYGYGVTLLKTDNGLTGSGIAYTLGAGTNLVCDAIQILAEPLKGR